MSKVVFTKEQAAELKSVYVDLSFKGIALSGKFNANTLTPYDLLTSTNVNTLINLRGQLKKEISSFEEDHDEFTATDYQRKQNEQKKMWERFLYLLIGYKRAQEQKADAEKELKELRIKAKELKEQNMTPEDKIKALEELIKEKEGLVGDESEETEAAKAE